MEARQGELVVRLLAALLVAASPAALAASDGGTVSGSLILDGEAVPLRFAYASTRPGFFDKASEDVRVLLSDVPLSEEARRDVFELIRLARDGSARVVEVVLDAELAPISGALYARPFEGMVSAAGMHRFEKQRFERNGVAGRLYVEKTQEFDGVRWSYDASFSTEIPRPPTLEEQAAALASPPADAARAWLAAVRAGALEAVRALLSPKAAPEWRGEGGRTLLRRAQVETPSDARVVGLERPSTTAAVATVNGTRASDGMLVEFTLALVLAEGAWRVTP